MRVKVLASGSSGNCYLVQGGGHNLLVDCGLSATNLQKFLQEEGVDVSTLSGIFITHDHHDHLSGAGIVSRRWGIPVYANRNTLKEARFRWEKIEKLQQERYGRPVSLENRYTNLKELQTGDSISFGSLEIASFPVSHDAAETVCYTFKDEETQAVILTDLGSATPEIIEPLNNSKLIVLESNHDTEALWQGRYPYSLKKRVSGDQGHLSNEQSASILIKCLEESGLNHTVWLAHLSRENNSPALALYTMRKKLAEVGIEQFPLEVALRDRPSLYYESKQVYIQTRLF
jgi:phosphoribosyl 1,2-cyclic phosphodiesterase